MIQRSISQGVLRLSQKVPVITVTGPRQSGKTTLVKELFKDYSYVNMEDQRVKQFAEEDIAGFFSTYPEKIIIDETQLAPKLFSQIQILVDQSGQKGQFILTGSQNFQLLSNISQSLAGRTSIFNLLPFSIDELKTTSHWNNQYEFFLQTGFYPRLYDQNIAAGDWLPDYISTYIERDVRKMVNVTDLNRFRAFLKMCAGHLGQIVNFTKMASEIGVTYKTIQSWISILETSYILFLLPPYFRNFNKRIIRSPKLYFYDSGLACSLMNITSPDQLDFHFAKGALFESFIMAELMKLKFNGLLQGELFFWRDNHDNEIDCIIDSGDKIKAIEIKSGRTVNTGFLKPINFFNKIATGMNLKSYLVYGGDEVQRRTNYELINWQSLDLLAQS